MNAQTALDVTLAATAGASFLYSAVLAHRVAALRSTKKGIVPAVQALTEAAARTQREVDGMRTAADEAVTRLNEAFAALEARRQASEDLISVLDGQAAAAERAIRAAAEDRSAEVVRETERALEVLTQRARIELDALGDGVEIASRVRQKRDEATGDADAAKPAAEPERLPVQGPARQRGAASANPFLRAVEA